MRGSRALAAVAATGLSAALALGAVAPASASTSAATTTVALRSVSAVSAAKTPFPGKKPAAILALSVKTAKAASSYHIRVSVDEKAGVSKIDLVIGKIGARGSITGPTGTVQVIRVKKTVFLKADAKYWVANGSTDAQAKVIAGKWIGLKGNGAAVKQMLTTTSLSYWTTALGTIKPTTRVPGKVIARIPTVGLKAADGIVYIAAKGRPYPLLVTDPADANNTMAFSEWNKRVTVKAPKTLMVISL